MQSKSGFVSKAAKQGKLTIPLYKTLKQSPSLKQKTSSHEFTVHSLLYAVQAQKTPIDRHADVLETNRSPWFCRNPSTSHLHKQKLHSPNDKLTNKNLTAKQGALHKTLKKKLTVSLQQIQQKQTNCSSVT